MSTTLATSDALAGLEVPKRFDVTKFPRDVEASVERTVNPFHRAILKNYFRHLLLEISGYWDQILVPELTIDEPVYRIGHLGRTIVLIGHDEVASFYRTTCETGKNVMGALPMYMCVDDFGVVTEARWPRFSPIFSPATSRASQKPTPTPITCSRTTSSRCFSYTRTVKLVGDASTTTRPATTTRNSIPRTSLLQKMPDANLPHCSIAPRPCTKPTLDTRVRSSPARTVAPGARHAR
jgi:hypothetical protein